MISKTVSELENEGKLINNPSYDMYQSLSPRMVLETTGKFCYFSLHFHF